jgi:hypothetical protein
MRLEAIEKPSNPLLKIAYWFSRKQFGKVLTPLKVIYSRKFPHSRFKIQGFKIEDSGILNFES